MAARRRPGLKYQWKNGTWHTRPEGASHRSNAQGSKPAPAPKPPPGTYDPALDAALGAAQRGYADLQADFARDFGEGGAGGRAFNDYQLQLQQIALGRTRSAEDRDNALANVRLGYQRLARGQAEQARVANVTSAGILGQQREIRAANQQRDEAPIHLAFKRMGEDFGTQQGQVGLGYQRAVTDAQTALERAGRETGQFGVDTAASRLHQATQTGWRPPRRRRRPGGAR